MNRKIAFLCLALLVLCSAAQSGEWWEEKPSSDWSLDQTVELLNHSPWVGQGAGYFRQLPLAAVHYQARIISARPVREAFLRLNALNANVINVREIGKSTATEEMRKRMMGLAAAYPDDLLVKGDDKHVIIAVSLKVKALGITGPKGVQEDFDSDELLEVDQSKLSAGTILRTNAGKRVKLELFKDPGKSRAGSTYYFPRNLPDGIPLVSAEDRELYFETVINKRQVSVKFDLSKMKYQGRLEL
jgi:hypothetical protein